MFVFISDGDGAESKSSFICAHESDLTRLFVILTAERIDLIYLDQMLKKKRYKEKGKFFAFLSSESS